MKSRISGGRDVHGWIETATATIYLRQGYGEQVEPLQLPTPMGNRGKTKMPFAVIISKTTMETTEGFIDTTRRGKTCEKRPCAAPWEKIMFEIQPKSLILKM